MTSDIICQTYIFHLQNYKVTNVVMLKCYNWPNKDNLLKPHYEGMMYSYTTYIIPYRPRNYWRITCIQWMLFPISLLKDLGVVSVRDLVWQHRSLHAHTHIKASSALQSTLKWVQEMVSVTQGYRSHEPRDAKVEKKASLLVKAQLGKQDIPASSSFSWADRKKKPSGYCVTEKSV